MILEKQEGQAMAVDTIEKLKLLKLDRSVDHFPSVQVPQRSRPRLSLAVAVVPLSAVLLSLGYFAGQKVSDGSAGSAAAEQRQVSTAVVETPPPDAPAIVASGYVIARRSATIAAQVTGLIDSIMVQEGDWVSQGDLIARLDSQAANVGVESAQATVRAASADIGRLRAHKLEAQIIRDRLLSLSERGFVRKAEVTQAITNVAALDAEILRADAVRDGNEASVRSARINAYRSDIRAPFAGIVTQVSAQPGEVISPLSAGNGLTRTGICTIVDMSSLELEVDVAETQIAQVAKQQPVSISLDAYPSDRFTGRVIAIVPVADRSRASFRVRIAFDRLTPNILPEMSAKVEFMRKNA